MEMEKLSSLLPEEEPPEHLYHYTSIDGAKGILGENSLLASQIHFLNDTQEFKYSIGIFQKVLAELRKELPEITMRAIGGPPPPSSDPNVVLRILYGSMEDLILAPELEKPPICVFSLSEEGDLLSQWRGYCPPGGGYSIGFRSDSLTQFLKTHGLYLSPCIYYDTNQEAAVKEAVTKIRDATLKRLSPSGVEIQKVIEEHVIQFFIDFSRVASTLKHPSFHQESEWRIISGLIANENMSFRVRKSMLLPYFSISFKDFEPFLIDEIIIGPAPEQLLAESSLRQFVLQKKLNISIKTSKTPYREL
jgi:hypothetical protein